LFAKKKAQKKSLISHFGGNRPHSKVVKEQVGVGPVATKVKN
jgi:hypothetical protein